MTPNMGSTDRIVRIVIAIVAAIVAVKAGGALGIVLWIVAAIMLLTSIVRFCPLYLPFKINTNKSA